MLGYIMLFGTGWVSETIHTSLGFVLKTSHPLGIALFSKFIMFFSLQHGRLNQLLNRRFNIQLIVSLCGLRVTSCPEVHYEGHYNVPLHSLLLERDAETSYIHKPDDDKYGELRLSFESQKERDLWASFIQKRIEKCATELLNVELKLFSTPSRFNDIHVTDKDLSKILPTRKLQSSTRPTLRSRNLESTKDSIVSWHAINESFSTIMTPDILGIRAYFKLVGQRKSQNLQSSSNSASRRRKSWFGYFTSEVESLGNDLVPASHEGNEHLNDSDQEIILQNGLRRFKTWLKHGKIKSAET